jgi:hypothetical protein
VIRKLAEIVLLMNPIFKESLIKVFISDGILFVDQLPAISSSMKRLIEIASIPFTSRDSHPNAKKIVES